MLLGTAALTVTTGVLANVFCNDDEQLDISKDKPVKYTNVEDAEKILKDINSVNNYDFLLQTLAKDIAMGYFIGDMHVFENTTELIWSRPGLSLSAIIDVDTATCIYRSNCNPVSVLDAVMIYANIHSYYTTPRG